MVSSSGRTVAVTVILGCAPNGTSTVDVTLTQGDAEGGGRIVELCTGVSEVHAVQVQAHGPDRFGSGPAEECAVAISREQGRVVETRQWCRADPVELLVGG